LNAPPALREIIPRVQHPLALFALKARAQNLQVEVHAIQTFAMQERRKTSKQANAKIVSKGRSPQVELLPLVRFVIQESSPAE